MSGNASQNELGQMAEFVGCIAKAAALFAPKMTKQARQSWIGLPPREFADVLEKLVFLPATPVSSFERNQHGHIVLTVTGLDLTGEREIARLLSAEYRVGDYAKSCLLSKKKDGYDVQHRLVDGQEYKIALVPGREIEEDSHRTTQALRDVGIGRYGYQKPLAGIMPRIRETVSDKQMEEMGFWYIAGLHDPIKDSDGDPRVLRADRYDGGRWLRTDWGTPDDRWGDRGAFAFLLSAS
jgi:hypothetical protein